MSKRESRDKKPSSGRSRKRRPRPEPGKQASTGAVTLRTFDVGAMPLVNHILERMGLEEYPCEAVIAVANEIIPSCRPFVRRPA